MRIARFSVAALGTAAWFSAYTALAGVQEPLPASALPVLVIFVVALCACSVAALYLFSDRLFASLASLTLSVAGIATLLNWCSDLNSCEGSWTSGWLRSGTGYLASGIAVALLLAVAIIRSTPVALAPLTVSSLAMVALLDNVSMVQAATGFFLVPLVAGFLGWGMLLVQVATPPIVRTKLANRLKLAAAAVEHTGARE